MKPTLDYFRRKLQQAKPIEDEAIKIICEKNDVSLIERQDETNYQTMKYDFQTSDGLTYEVKADFRAPWTGNVFIETVQFGKPSGIAITEAMYHIFYFSDTYHIIDTEELLFLCEHQGTKKYVPMTNSQGYCIEVDEFVKCCDSVLKVDISNDDDEIDISLI